MIQNKFYPNNWMADENKTFIRKIDNFNMGEDIWLGVNDSIDNYESVKIENYDDEA